MKTETQNEVVPLKKQFEIGAVMTSGLIEQLMINYSESYAAVLVKHMICEWKDTPPEIVHKNKQCLGIGLGVVISVHRVAGVPVVCNTVIHERRTVVFVQGEKCS